VVEAPVNVREVPLRPRSFDALGTDRLVVALARWDRLKDPVGIVRSFAEQVRHPRARLIVAGPATGAIQDDPGARGVLRATHAAWRDCRRRSGAVSTSSPCRWWTSMRTP